MQIRVLGPVEVECDGAPINLGGPQQRRLLAVLVLQRGRAVSTDRLVDAMWPDGDPPDAAGRSMRTYLSRLRNALPGTSIVTQSGGYVFDVDGAGVDVDQFDDLLREAESSLPDRALCLYDEALRLWRGDPFGEFGDEWWALPESTRLRERRTSAELERAETQMAMGHHNRAIADLERLAAERPLDERPITLLMQALVATGRQAESMQVARAFRGRLGEQTGLEPSAQLARLENTVAAGGAATAPPLGRPLRGYTLHEAIGEGAHGRVYTATQPGTERLVAVKVIRPDLADSADFVIRFEAEARLIARLEHPHIVPLYDAWREPGGAFLVFRLLGGGTLRDSIIAGGPWSLPRVAVLVEQIGGALIAAHGAGVTHRDVKASNVLLDDAGAAYLGDFGIAVADGGRPTDDAGAAAGDVRDFSRLLWEVLAGEQGPPSSLLGRIHPLPDGLDAVLRRGRDGGYDSVAELVLGFRAAVGGQEGGRSSIPSDERRAVDSARRAAARQLVISTSAGVNPYRGLRAFDEADAAAFHGREAAIDDLVTRVDACRLVTVVGASGSGKSSVVLAGLVPRLRSCGDVVVTMVPGDDPVGALRTVMTEVATLSSDESLTDVARRLGRVVLVVDQFEECWTRAPESDRHRFAVLLTAAITDHSADVRVVATVRADLLDRPLEDPMLGPHVGAGSYVLAPLSPAELDAVVVRPAARVGVTFEDGVVADLVAEAVGSAGTLPLLQFTLTELYDRRVDGLIGRRALHDVGGMAGAIGRRAEEVYASLDASRQAAARALFGRLVAPGQGAPDTRRRARLGELSPGMRSVADEFVAARLLVADRDLATREPTVELAHEALLTRWARLVDWVSDDRRWLTQLQHLSVAARAWDDAGRSDGELYRGVRLEAAIEALDEDGRTVTDVERAFVEAGRRARDADVTDARRTAKRLRRRLVVVAAALVVAVVAGAVAVVQRRDADQARASADVAASVAEQERAAAADAAASAQDAATDARIEALVGRAEALRRTQRDVAALLALEAYRLADTPRTRSSLFAMFTDDERFLDAHRLDGNRGSAGIVMPDGEAAYLIGEGGRLQPYDLDTGELGAALPATGGPEDRFPVLAASADGRLLVQASRSDASRGPTTVAVHDTTDRTTAFTPITVDGAVTSAVFLRDPDRVALTIGEEGHLIVFDAETGTELASVSGVSVPADDVVWTLEPDAGTAGRVLRRPAATNVIGDALLVGTSDGSLRVFDAATIELRQTVAAAPESLAALRPLSDGTVVTSGRLGLARIDLSTGSAEWQIRQQETCVNLTVADARGTFYCGDPYGRLHEHDLQSGNVRRTLDAQNGNTGSLWTARDGTELVSFGNFEAVVARWRLDGSGPVTRVLEPGWTPYAFNHTGAQLLIETGHITTGDYATRVLDSMTGETVARPEGLIVPAWNSAHTLLGATLGATGEIEPAEYDLDEGSLTSLGSGMPVDEALKIASNELDTGKDHALFRYREGTDNWLARFDTGTLQAGPRIPVDGLVAWAIDRAGDRIVAGTSAGVLVFDAHTGERIGAIARTDLRSVFVTVTDQLFVGSLGGELVQYDLETLRPLRSFGGSRGFVFGGAGTADGSMVAISGGDHRVVLYDVASGTEIGTPIAVPEGQQNQARLSLDGRWLALGGERVDDGSRDDHPFQIWDLDPEAWREAACRVAGRNLTREEWEAHIGDLAAYRATCSQHPVDS
jgi:DNA-binding SARP family transcriptional activator/tRNA A-37 threonylcarbamoyl transferase component Bud32/outer membrane protein assembly factor BamB